MLLINIHQQMQTEKKQYDYFVENPVNWPEKVERNLIFFALEMQ